MDNKCKLCGEPFIHACPGQKIYWDEAKKAALNKALDSVRANIQRGESAIHLPIQGKGKEEKAKSLTRIFKDQAESLSRITKDQRETWEGY